MSDDNDARLSGGGEQQPLVYELADETMNWVAEAPMGQREDVRREVWAFALATFVDGTPITPRGFDESEVVGCV